jgi:hypothetical protein
MWGGVFSIHRVFSPRGMLRQIPRGLALTLLARLVGDLELALVVAFSGFFSWYPSRSVKI